MEQRVAHQRGDPPHHRWYSERLDLVRRYSFEVTLSEENKEQERGAGSRVLSCSARGGAAIKSGDCRLQRALHTEAGSTFLRFALGLRPRRRSANGYLARPGQIKVLMR